MAKKKFKGAEKPVEQEAEHVSASMQTSVSNNTKTQKYGPMLLLFIFSLCLYINTTANQYAVDDTLVVSENKFTQKGFAGLKEIFTTDAFEGFFGERGKSLVAGGRYRPLSIATFAAEISIFGKNKPGISHFNNALLYGFCIILVYLVLLLLFPLNATQKWYLSIPFLVAMIYAAHPIHTEAVANIKGRDEIMGMLFLMLALYACIRYFQSNDNKFLVLQGVAYCLAVLSKENAITFIALAFLTAYVFLEAKKEQYIKVFVVYSIPTIVFLFMRSHFTSSALSKFTTEIMNDPFTFSSFSQKFGTLFYTYLMYIKLMLFPHPLTHDYYPYQIPKVELTSLFAMLSIVVNVALFVYACHAVWTKKDKVAYGLLFYFISFSIVSQIFFTVGTTMNERFVFIPSLGFLLAIILFAQQKLKDKSQIFYGSILLVLVLFSVKTISRNMDWKNNYVLFLHDVQISENSAKLNMATGGALLDSAKTQVDTVEKYRMIAEAIEHLNKSIEIYGDTTIMDQSGKPQAVGYANAYNLLGNAYFMSHKDLANAEKAYKMAAYYQPGHYDAYQNLVVIYNEEEKWSESVPLLGYLIEFQPDNAGFYYKMGDALQHTNRADSALIFYKKAMQLDPKLTTQAYFQMGVCEAQQLNNFAAANSYFDLCLKSDPKLKSAIDYQMGLAYAKYRNDIPTGMNYIAKALAVEPNNIHYNEDYGVCLAFSHRPAEAIGYFRKCLQIDPGYSNVIRNLFNAYSELGRTDSAMYYKSLIK